MDEIRVTETAVALLTTQDDAPIRVTAVMVAVLVPVAMLPEVSKMRGFYGLKGLLKPAEGGI